MFERSFVLVASTHLMVGAALGTATVCFSRKSCWLILSGAALILGIVSHFILDLIPHAEYDLNGYGRKLLIVLIVELALTLILVYVGAFQNRPCFSAAGFVVLSGMIGAALPDISELAIKMLHINWAWLAGWERFNSIFHASPNDVIVAGIFSQLLIVVLAFAAIAILSLGCAFFQSSKNPKRIGVSLKFLR